MRSFDHIDQGALLQIIGDVPGRELIRQWLKAGYLDGDGWHPTEAGTPQGGVISPLLANIALHGMEEAIGMTHTKGGRLSSNRAVVRYADDFAVTCTTREEAERTIEQLIPWLAARGLTFSMEKTRIVHISEGFDFLGFTIRQYAAPFTKKRGVALRCTPSRASVRRVRERLRDEWMALRGHPAREVTARLNPIIRGWANYFRIGVSSRTFQALDDWMFQREVRYVKRTHPNKPWHWQRAQYWGPFHPQRNDHWVFGDDRSGAMLLKFKWFRIYRHPLVTGTASPDDPALAAYWAERRRKQAYGLTPSKRKLAQRQGYICPLCGDSLLDDEELHVHHERWRSRGGTDSYDNLSLHHLYCHQQVHAGNQP